MNPHILNRLTEAQKALNRGSLDDAKQLIAVAIELTLEAKENEDFRECQLVRFINSLVTSHDVPAILQRQAS